ncbi:hypothetical protein J437_LFUL005687 [Ladona fulva]|uniref:Cuticle protein n=1 Tax=Ladona fulva TaxID=123851 RepID=A0A8K0P2V7_LADFU|nr:hypothetical protein J437_LFUL005687 [Ladona fulva]
MGLMSRIEEDLVSQWGGDIRQKYKKVCAVDSPSHTTTIVMATKFCILAALLATVNAAVIQTPVYHTPVVYQTPVVVAKTPVTKVAKVPVVEESDFDPNPSYSFSYDVHDEITGDSKSRSETLDNGVVTGSYSLVYPDGVRRTVEYTADDVHGFNAVIHEEPPNVVIKTPVVKAVAPAPVIPVKPAVVATPAVHHIPIAPGHKVYSTPIPNVVPFSFSNPHLALQPAPIALNAVPVNRKVLFA